MIPAILLSSGPANTRVQSWLQSAVLVWTILALSAVSVRMVTSAFGRVLRYLVLRVPLGTLTGSLVTAALLSTGPAHGEETPGSSASVTNQLGTTNKSLVGPSHLKIGISVSDLGNPYFHQLAEGAEAEAKRLVGADRVEIDLQSSAYDLERQLKQIRYFVDQKVQLILLVAANYEGVSPGIELARAEGIPVLAVDVQAKGADVTVTTDNFQAGFIACEHLANALGGSGKLVILNGPNVTSIHARVQGCESALSQFPNIRLLSTSENAGASRLGGLEVMTHLLMAYPKIDGAFAINDPTAVGAEQAAALAQHRLLISSVDGAPLAIERMKDPYSMIMATAAQRPIDMAALAVRMGYGLLMGIQPEQTHIKLPAYLISANKDQPDSQ
jgi:ribose transport system substrate-binding protein